MDDEPARPQDEPLPGEVFDGDAASRVAAIDETAIDETAPPAPVPAGSSADDDATPTGRGRHRRPFGLLVLAGLMLFKAALLAIVLLGVALNPDGVLQAFGGKGVVPGAELGVSTGVLIVLLVVLVASAVGLLLGLRQGWLLAMVATGVFIATDIAGFASGSTNHFWMALNIVTVFYLNQADVRAVFGAADVMGGDPEPAGAG